MLDALKKWLTPLNPNSDGRESSVPAHLPEDQNATFNQALHQTPHETVVDTFSKLAAARWDVYEDPADAHSGDTVVVSAEEKAANRDHVLVPKAKPTAGYRLHRVIARGGFGEIWEATQEVLSRTVAVKRLRQDIIDRYKDQPDHLYRLELSFRQEALVAAYLEHPNILPVHDLGLDQKGHLLLATKLVRGKPWDELLDRDEILPIDQILEIHLPILREVAQAVAFAHSRGIVHRDLKPPQVMVGEFGEVLLMDWGIAMYIAGSPDQPREELPDISQFAPNRITASNPAGTVGYMAPEQTEEEVDHIGPWTDIYLLGGLLYKILTNRQPHHGESHHHAFFEASMGIVKSPWEIEPKRDMPAPLVQLAMDCLQPKCDERLSSAQEFIRRLDDYTTGASRRREAATLLQRVAPPEESGHDYKRLAHDQSLVERAISLWPGNHEAERLHESLTLRIAQLALTNHDLKLARLHTERLSESNAERASILKEVERLEEEKARARERLDQAYAKTREAHSRADRLVTFLLEDLHNSLQEVNRLDLMARVGREALEYFDSFSGEEPTTDAMAKRAVASRNIGDVFRDQGNLEGAAAAFRTFQETSQRLVDMDPTSSSGRALLASACERMSGVEYLRGNLDEAIRLLENGLKLTRELLTDPDSGPEEQYLHGKLVHQEGIVLWRRRKLDDAYRIQSESLAIFQKLATEHPERTDFQQAYGWNLSTMGNVYRDKGDLPEAIRHTEMGLDIRSRLAEEHPDNKAVQDDVCWSLTNLALLREYIGHTDEALQTYAEAADLRRRLVAEDPTNAVHRNKLTFILSSQGRNLYGLGRYEEAANVTGESCDVSRGIIAADPTNTHEIGSHALNMGYHGLALYMSGRIDESRAILAEGQPCARRALEAVPENGVYQNAVCQSLILEGLLARDDGDPARARACWETAMALLEKQFWRRTTGQGMGMHLELSVYLGNREDALADAEELRKNNWMLPRWEKLLEG